MPPPTAIDPIRPFIATPAYSGTLTTHYVRSLLALSNAAWTHGFPLLTRFVDGDALITRARNELVAEFMADATWTHLFWIDADIGFEPEAALRLMRAGRDVVAGIYPLRIDAWPPGGLAQALPAGASQADFEARHARFCVNALPDAQPVDADGFVEVQEIGTGFMLIARRVFERMAGHYAELRYSSPGSAPDGRDHCRYRFFDVDIDAATGAYVSEDFAFCRRWRAIGGKVFADVRSKLTHTGPKTFGGDFEQAMRQRTGLR